MEVNKYEGTSSPLIINKYEIGNDEMMNQAISQLESAFELGLAGLREYLNQLAPEEREKVILSISNNIQNY